MACCERLFLLERSTLGSSGGAHATSEYFPGRRGRHLANQKTGLKGKEEGGTKEKICQRKKKEIGKRVEIIKERKRKKSRKKNSEFIPVELAGCGLCFKKPTNNCDSR